MGSPKREHPYTIKGHTQIHPSFGNHDQTFHRAKHGKKKQKGGLSTTQLNIVENCIKHICHRNQRDHNNMKSIGEHDCLSVPVRKRKVQQKTQNANGQYFVSHRSHIVFAKKMAKVSTAVIMAADRITPIIVTIVSLRLFLMPCSCNFIEKCSWSHPLVSHYLYHHIITDNTV